AGTGRIDDARRWRRRLNIDAGADDAAAAAAEFDDDRPRRAPPAVKSGTERRAPRVHQRLVAVQKQTVHRFGEGAELRIVHQPRIPAEVPGARDTAAAELIDDRDPGAARTRIERKMHVSPAH